MASVIGFFTALSDAEREPLQAQQSLVDRPGGLELSALPLRAVRCQTSCGAKRELPQLCD